MAYTGLTFKLYDDSGLTTEFDGTLEITHFTDLSDNSQDFVKYFGSTTASRQLQATSNPGVDSITLTPTDALPNWATATAYSVGDCVQPSSGNENGYRYECTTAGTSHASTEPTWPTSGIGTTVTDGTAVWTFKGAKHEPTEIKLATSSGGLASAVAGAALDLGATVTSEVANLVEVHIRVTNAVTNVSNNAGCVEITLDFNEVVETET